MSRKLSVCLVCGVLALVVTALCIDRLPSAVGLEPDDPACGDANGDSQVDIGDAIYVLSYLFSGGPEPVCPPPVDPEPDPELERLIQLEEMAARKGDPAYATTPTAMALVEGVDPVFFLPDGIILQEERELALVPAADGLLQELTLVMVPDVISLLDFALLALDAGDPVAIKYRSSQCLQPVPCDPQCHPAGLFFHATDAPIGNPRRCERVENERATCIDRIRPVCRRRLYFDGACTRLRATYTTDGWRCN